MTDKSINFNPRVSLRRLKIDDDIVQPQQKKSSENFSCPSNSTSTPSSNIISMAEKQPPIEQAVARIEQPVAQMEPNDVTIVDLGFAEIVNFVDNSDSTNPRTDNNRPSVKCIMLLLNISNSNASTPDITATSSVEAKLPEPTIEEIGPQNNSTAPVSSDSVHLVNGGIILLYSIGRH